MKVSLDCLLRVFLKDLSCFNAYCYVNKLHKPLQNHAMLLHARNRKKEEEKWIVSSISSRAMGAIPNRKSCNVGL